LDTGDTTTPGRYIHKEEKNFMRVRDVRGQYVQIPLTDTFSGETQVLQVFNRVLSVEQRQILWHAIARHANLVEIRE
jgi:hypothetical protein